MSRTRTRLFSDGGSGAHASKSSSMSRRVNRNNYGQPLSPMMNRVLQVEIAASRPRSTVRLLACSSVASSMRIAGVVSTNTCFLFWEKELKGGFKRVALYRILIDIDAKSELELHDLSFSSLTRWVAHWFATD